jgi:hypothetical protein
MAKSKKPESAAAEGATKKKAAETNKAATAPQAVTKKKAPAKAAAGGATSVPLIDTNLAAEAAARMLVSRAGAGGSAAAPSARPAEGPANDSQGEAAEKRESSTFKQLKDKLNKPRVGGVGGILGGGPAGKKGNTGFGGGNQNVGRNQTFGADVNRAGVPRRTGG